MKPPHPSALCGRRRPRAFTVPELMVAVLAGSLVLAVVAGLSVYALRSFVAISHYTEMDAKDQLAIDTISRELRSCTDVFLEEANLPTRRVAFSNTTDRLTVTLTWNKDLGTLTTTITNYATGAVKITTNLTQCDDWTYKLYQQTPIYNTTNGFNPFQGGTNRCKLIAMSWKCSRTMLGKKWHTESVQTAKIVLRNAR
jgi:Tfp pilus assembly protein PilW